jgi:hypothetical protein
VWVYALIVNLSSTIYGSILDPGPMRKLAKYVPPDLLARARELEALRQALESCVDHSLYRHCAPLHLDNGILYVGCDSAIWAGRLRLLARSLVPRLSSACGLPVRKIEAVVTPQAALSITTRPGRPVLKVDPEVARYLESAAGTIDHEQLGDALRRLARRIAERAPEAD